MPGGTARARRGPARRPGGEVARCEAPARSRNRSAARAAGWATTAASTARAAITAQPGAPQVQGEERVEAREDDRPDLVAQAPDALVVAEAAVVGQLGLEAPVGGRLPQLGPVIVTWPSQISTIETQPTVSWVALMTRHDSTNDQPQSRTARSAPGPSPSHGTRAPGAHRHHRVGAEQPGEQRVRRVGALDEPQRHDDVEQHLVGGEDAVARRQQHEAAVAPGGRRRAGLRRGASARRCGPVDRGQASRPSRRSAAGARRSGSGRR